MSKLFNYYSSLAAGILICGSNFTVEAEHLTPQNALQRIVAIPGMKKVASNSDSYKLVYTETIPGGIETLYIFEREGNRGFVVASADDTFPAILGYADSGSFDYKSAPPAFKWWLNQYSAEEEWGLNHPVPLVAKARIADRKDIPALVKTQWNQSYPFNDDCPEYDGRRSVTGCIATAMAQVMNYHQYPDKGVGQHSYEYGKDTISYDFSKAYFDWDKMLDSYKENDESTPEQRQAVAKLMYACGVSVDMQYTPKESDSYDYLIPYALTEFFDYDRDILYRKRADYTGEQWADLIYAELSESRPVILSGLAYQGGHDFVCDGYEDNYFHINWGWGGLCDGFFLLSSLNPEQQGIGGYTGGYNTNQSAVLNIKKPTGAAASTYNLFVSGGLDMKDTELGGAVAIAIRSDGSIYLASPRAAHIDLMLKFVSDSGDVIYGDPQRLEFSATKGGNSYGYSGFTMRMPNKDSLNPGNYKVTLAYVAPDGNYVDLSFPVQTNSYVNMEVEANGKVNCSVGQPEEEIVLKVDELYATSEVEAGKTSEYHLAISNNSPYSYTSDYISIKLYHPDTDECLEEWQVSVMLGANESYSINFHYAVDVPDGFTYDMKCYDAYGNLIGTFKLPVGVENEVDSVAAIDQLSDVYTLSGVLLKQGVGREYITLLPSGVYLIRSKGRSLKIVK